MWIFTMVPIFLESELNFYGFQFPHLKIIKNNNNDNDDNNGDEDDNNK